jgi:hypothetical protein
MNAKLELSVHLNLFSFVHVYIHLNLISTDGSICCFDWQYLDNSHQFSRNSCSRLTEA